jgi:hypothetical protein
MKLFRHYPFLSLGITDIPVRIPPGETLLYALQYVISEAYFSLNMIYRIHAAAVSFPQRQMGPQKNQKKRLDFTY